MSDRTLTAALVLRLVDRLSAPARAAARALSGVSKEERAVGKASAEAAKGVEKSRGALDGAAKAAGRNTLAAGAARRATDILGRAAQAGARAQDQSARSTTANARAADELARSEDRAGAATERTINRFSRLEKAQARSRAAARVLGGEMRKLDRHLGTLAKAQIATMGLDQVGRGIMGPLTRAVGSSANFGQGMTGIGLTADLSDSQLKPVRTDIFATAKKLGMANERAQAVYAAVLNEGVYRDPKELMAASRSVAGFQKLAEVAGDPLDDKATGSLTTALSVSLGKQADQLDGALAKAFRSSQLGGVRMGTVGRFLPETLGILKGFGAGNDRSYADLLATFQIVKKAAGDDEQAGIYTKDFLSSLAQKHTGDRFKKAAGIDLQAVIVKGNRDGQSPITAVVDAVSEWLKKEHMAGAADDKLDQFLESKLLINQQAASALRALTQNRAGFDQMRKEIAAPSSGNYEAAKKRAGATASSDYTRFADAKNHLGVVTGDILAPAARFGAGALGGVADGLTAMEEKGGALGKVGAFAAAGVGGLALAAGALTHGIVGILTPIVTLRFLMKGLPLSVEAVKGPILGLTSRVLPAVAAGARVAAGGIVAFAAEAIPAVLGFSAALLTSPITWIVAGVAALAVGGFLLIKHWSVVKTWLGGFWDWLKKTAGDAIAAVLKFFTFKPPPWLGKIAGIAAALATGGPVAAAAAAAGAVSASPPTVAARGPASAHAAAPGARPITVNQHFHGVQAKDDKTLARELHREGQAGQARALHDGANG